MRRIVYLLIAGLVVFATPVCDDTSDGDVDVDGDVDGDADGDTLITGVDVNAANSFILSKPYVVDTIQPANPLDDWNTMEVDGDRLLTGVDVNAMNAFILSKPVALGILSWTLEAYNWPGPGQPPGVAVAVPVSLKSNRVAEGDSGRAGLAIEANINGCKNKPVTVDF